MSDRRLRLIAGSETAGDQVLRILDETTIRVELEARPPWRRQVLAWALVDLLGRLFPRIEVRGAEAAPAHALLPPGPALLRDRLESARTHGISPQPAAGDPAVTIVIGEGAAVEGAVYCDGDGWQSYLGPASSELLGDGDEDVPIGALAAACRAAAHAFALAMVELRGLPHALDPTYSSALTYQAADRPLDDPVLRAPSRVHAVLGGAGSVGGAAGYAFARVPDLGGELDIVDPQVYEPHNPDRALLATEARAAARAEKAQSVADVLSHLPDLHARPFRGTFETWVASRPIGPLPLALSTFDSIDARRELQDSLPLDVINAACGEDDIAVSGHRTDDGPCVYCLHIAQVLDTERITFKLIVATTGLPPRLVQAWMEQHVRLDASALAQIERNREFAPGTLSTFVGCTLLELHRRGLGYGEEALQTDEGTAAVAAPWVTALAGFLLAGEALKAGDHETFSTFRLGPWAPGRTHYAEELYASARHAIVSPVPRWEGTECLCRSTRRLRLLAERYDV